MVKACSISLKCGAAVAATLLLFSCERMDEVSRERSDEIVFGVEMGSPSVKSMTESDVASVKAGGFNVAAVTADGVVLFNEKASWNSSKAWFSTSGTYYWPSAGTTAFYAVHPVSRSVTVTGTAATLGYAHDGVTDLVAASKSVSSPASGSVTLLFSHLLAQVNVMAKSSDPAVTCLVKAVTVTGSASGVYSYASDAWTPGSSSVTETVTDTDTAVGTAAYVSLGESRTFVPAELTVRAVWECLAGGTVTASYDRSVTFTPEAGKNSIVRLTLPNDDAVPLAFTLEVTPWGEQNTDIELND